MTYDKPLVIIKPNTKQINLINGRARKMGIQTEQMKVEKVVEFLRANGAGTHAKRSKLAKFTCDLVLPGTARNDDSLMRGPDERILFGSRGEVAYPIESLARYMVRRGLVIEKSKHVSAV